MPDALRAPYDGDLRHDLLAEAIDVIAARGPSGVSLRALAREVGVSHAAPKNHFPTKRALFSAVATDGHRRLASAMSDELERVARESDPRPPDPVTMLTASGRAYLRFARSHPGHFAVMFRDDLLDSDDEALSEASTATLDQLASLAGASMDDLGLAPGDAPTLVLLAWALVHGLASLHASASLDDVVGDATPATVDDAVVELMARLLRARESNGVARPRTGDE